MKVPDESKASKPHTRSIQCDGGPTATNDPSEKLDSTKLSSTDIDEG